MRKILFVSTAEVVRKVAAAAQEDDLLAAA